MTAQHLSTESLSVLLEKGESVLSAGDRAHLADCPACHEEIAALREVIDELGRSEQETEIELTELVQDRLARLHALDRRLEAEIHRAKNLVATKRTASQRSAPATLRHLSWPTQSPKSSAETRTISSPAL